MFSQNTALVILMMGELKVMDVILVFEIKNGFLLTWY